MSCVRIFGDKFSYTCYVMMVNISYKELNKDIQIENLLNSSKTSIWTLIH